jgi:hypothetical protein
MRAALSQHMLAWMPQIAMRSPGLAQSRVEPWVAEEARGHGLPDEQVGLAGDDVLRAVAVPFRRNGRAMLV